MQVIDTSAYLTEGPELVLVDEVFFFPFVDDLFLFFTLFDVVFVEGKAGKIILCATGTMLVSVEAGAAFFFFFLGGPLQ